MVPQDVVLLGQSPVASVIGSSTEGSILAEELRQEGSVPPRAGEGSSQLLILAGGDLRARGVPLLRWADRWCNTPVLGLHHCTCIT